MDKSIKITIDNQEYIIKFPNVGQILDIESMKTALSSGRYNELVKMNTKSSNWALDIIDSIATFSILIPQLREKLNVDSYTELDQFEAKKIVKPYIKTYYPFYKEIHEELQKFNEDDEE